MLNGIFSAGNVVSQPPSGFPGLKVSMGVLSHRYPPFGGKEEILSCHRKSAISAVSVLE